LFAKTSKLTLFAIETIGIVDAGGKFTACVVDIGGKLTAVIVDTGGKFTAVHLGKDLTAVADNGGKFSAYDTSCPFAAGVFDTCDR
jgi:hypothetical protein